MLRPAASAVPRRSSRFAFAVLALYAAVLTVAPFVHHDLTCELKTPQHCVACTTTMADAKPAAPPALLAGVLADAGQAIAVDVQAESQLFVARTSGRSPPAAS